MRRKGIRVADLVRAVTGMDINTRALAILGVVVVAAVLLFVLQSDEKTAPAPNEKEHVVHWSYEPGTGPACSAMTFETSRWIARSLRCRQTYAPFLGPTPDEEVTG